MTDRKHKSELGKLADPNYPGEPLRLEGWAKDDLRKFLREMVNIRLVEEEIGRLVEQGLAQCPCHLGIGQEAVATGVSHHLRATDRVFGGHRSHSHYLTMGGDRYALIAEVLGKADGCSKGMGGSMHLQSVEHGFFGSVPIVGATIPIAAGAGLAAQMDGRGDVAVSYFGDGTSEEGVLHECLNFASVFGLPVLFVCENNFYSSHLDIKLRQPSDRVSRFAEAHHIPFKVVDGNNVLEVADAALELIARARSGGGAGFLEAVTHRWRGHVGPDENIDVGVRRTEKDLRAWRGRDPVMRLRAAMEAAKLLTPADFERMNADLRAEIEIEHHRAVGAPYPDTSALLDLVYAQATPARPIRA